MVRELKAQTVFLLSAASVKRAARYSDLFRYITFYARFMSDKNILMLNVILSEIFDVIRIQWTQRSFKR